MNMNKKKRCVLLLKNTKIWLLLSVNLAYRRQQFLLGNSCIAKPKRGELLLTQKVENKVNKKMPRHHIQD